MSIDISSITIADLASMPSDDGIDRELIRGELKERPMTRRNRFHAATESRVAGILMQFLNSNPNIGAEVLSGEVGVVLARDPDSEVGIDVAVFSLDTLRAQTDESTMISGVPLLAAEILSPSDTQKQVEEKIREYLRVGVAVVWIIEPSFQTITAYRKDSQPTLFNREQSISCDEVLPSFQAAVSNFFPDWSSEQT